MVGEKISLRRRIGLAVLTVLMVLSAVFGAIIMRGIFGDTTQTANAEGVTVGATDNTSAFNTAESAWVEIAANDTVTFSFTNYSLGEEVYHNWNILFWGPVVGTEATWNCIRTDNYAWGGYFDEHQPTTTNDYQTALENDKALFDGATVNIVFTRANGVFSFVATMVTTNDTTYTKTVSVELADTEYANLRLLVDHSHFENVVIHRYNANTWSQDSTGHWNACMIDGCSEKFNFAAHEYDYDYYDSVNHWGNCSVCNTHNVAAHTFTDGVCECSFEEGTKLVGRTDYLSGYNAYQSEAVELTDGQQVVFTFTNHNSGNGELFHNWIAGVATSDFPTTKTDADLKVLLRVDNYEIVNNTNNDERLTSNYNWDNFVGKMNGSTVTLTVTYQDGIATVHADIVASTNDKYFIQFVETVNADRVYAFLTNEASYQIISSVVKKYTVTYETNGGSVVEAEQYLTALPDPLPTPTKEGYTFAGWFTDEQLTVSAVAGASITENTTLYANWTINTNTVTFVTAHGNAPEAQNVEYNATATKPADPTANGYTFNGWYLNDSEYDFATPVTSEISLTANWTEISETKIIGHHVELGGDIGVTFTVEFKAGENEGSYMIFTFEDGRASQRVDTAALTNNRFSYTARVNAMELAETFTATLYRVNAEPVEDSYSVMQYITAYKNSSIQTEKGVAILNALVNYGYYMQNSGWRDDLSDHALIDQYSSLSITSSEVISALSEKAITKGDYTGNVYQSLTLNADTKINLYFEGEVDVVEGAFSTPVYTNSLYKSTSGSINILNLGENKTLKIQVGETQYTITVSGLSYVYAALNSTAINNDQVNALIAYYEYYSAVQALNS